MWCEARHYGERWYLHEVLLYWLRDIVGRLNHWTGTMSAVYTDVLATAHDHGVNVSDIDTILVNEETYEQFRSKVEAESSVEVADYSTAATPAIRKTTGPERIVYVTESGEKREVEIESA